MIRLFRYLGPLAVQTAGSGATFAMAILLTRFAGIETQGQFSFIKSWSDTALTGLLFGLPQSLLHLSYHSDRTPSELYTFVLRYAKRLLLAALAVGGIAWGFGVSWLIWVSISAPALVLHGLVRSLLLRPCGPLTYAWITVLPALSLLAAVSAGILLGIQQWGACILASALLSAAACLWVAKRSGLSREGHVRGLGPESATTNVHAFVQSILSAAQVSGLLSLAGLLGASTSDVGELSLAFLAIQVLAVVAGFAAPAVYNAFAPNLGFQALLVEHKEVVWAAVLMLLLVLPITLLRMPWILESLFKVSTQSAIMACRIALVAGVFVLFNRFLSTLLQRAGYFVTLSKQSVARFVITFGLMVLVVHFIDTLTTSEAGALSVLIAEVVLFVWMIWTMRRFH